jgi:hypothetical protein
LTLLRWWSPDRVEAQLTPPNIEPDRVETELTPPMIELDLDEARRRFQLGVKLYMDGSFDAALAEFNKAYELAPNYRLLFNLAQVQVQRHDNVAALRLFNQYLEQGGSKIPPARRKQLERELIEVKARVAELWVRANVAGAELLIDGASVGRLPLKVGVPVSSGVRHIQLRKTGYETATRNITIAGNETLHVRMLMQVQEPVPSALAPPTRQKLETPRPQPAPVLASSANARTPEWVGLVSSGLLAGGAVTFALLTRTADDKLDAELNRFPPDSTRLEAARAAVRRNALLTDSFTAAALLTCGISLYFLLSDGDSSTTNPGAARIKVRFAPTGLGIGAIANF